MSRKEKVNGIFSGVRVITEDSNTARELYNQSRFGTVLDSGRVQLSVIEAFYLLDKKRLDLVDGRGKKIDEDTFIKRARRQITNFIVKYTVFKDLRDRGYIVKTALKFGADFRVYDRGVKPGEDHARWVVYPVHEGSSFTWHELSAKNRVAHSTKKRLLLGIVDEEGDVTYMELKWLRP